MASFFFSPGAAHGVHAVLRPLACDVYTAAPFCVILFREGVMPKAGTWKRRRCGP